MPTTITFTDPGDHAAMRAAEQWCADRGISVGRLQDLTLRQRGELDGTMLAESFRHGPVTVRLKCDIDPAPVGADQREVA